MAGQLQQPGSSFPHFEHHTSSHFSGIDSADAPAGVAASRWLHPSGGHPHSFPPPPLDPRLLQNFLLQDIARNGAQSSEERQKLLRILKSMGNGTEITSGFGPQHGSGQRSGTLGFSSQEIRGEIGGGILDVHSIDDVQLLSEDSVHESPFDMSTFAAEKGFRNDADISWSIYSRESGQLRARHEESSMQAPDFEKDVPIKDITSGLARIKVVVRKRPLNRKEISRKEEDIVSIDGNGCSLTVHEPKLKVDLTAYVEKHDFTFDAVLDEQVSNDEVYKVTVEPIIPTIFQSTKATCFAYGQTGSGKTYTMQPLPLRACQDILNIMHHPSYRNQGLLLWLSFFEIYGGKLYDLLNDRRKLCMREDGRQQVCIVGLKEFSVSDVPSVKDYIEKGNASRSTGSTGANEESSRSHAILQLAIKKHSNKKDEKGGKLVGKFSFIDLAGSERGADTTDNDRQTRIEGAEINKSLLALKECIRALDAEQGHIPFRGSKLTEVLRDSFVGDSRTIMISCISPNTGSCEHTLNTLRYADRVKGLSKTSNMKRDPSPNTGNQIQKESSSFTSAVLADVSHNGVDYKSSETTKSVGQLNRPPHLGQPDSFSSSSSNQCREDSTMASHSTDRDCAMGRDTMSNSFTYQYNRVPERTGQERVSPPRQKLVKDGSSNEESKVQRNGSMLKKATFIEEFMHLKTKDTMNTQQNGYDSQITAILEEEEDLIAGHRLEVEDTMDLVREEMRLLTEVDQPGSRIDQYVSQLSYVLSRKAAGIVNLQARLARFQCHLKEQEILSRGIDNG